MLARFYWWSTRRLSQLNMSCNAHTLLHEEHAYLSFVATDLTKLVTDKINSPLKRVEEMVRTTMVLVRGSELDGKVTAARHSGYKSGSRPRRSVTGWQDAKETTDSYAKVLPMHTTTTTTSTFFPTPSRTILWLRWEAL